ncbi:MAG: acetyltransferase [Acidobacteriaceae bacterium]|nr:acetyltransferase [Acidobacteriaceae bacterium]
MILTGPVIVYGAGGHGRVVADILRVCGAEIEGFIDDCNSTSNPNSNPSPSMKILGDARWLAAEARFRRTTVALGVGDNQCRRVIAEHCIQAGIRLVSAIHPAATIASSAKITAGAVIMAQAVVNPDTVVGAGAIINTGAVVEHDCTIGNFAHLSPRAAVGGNVHVSDLAWLGIGANVIPNLRIGTGSIVGAGSTVIHDIEDWVVAVGTPARTVKELAHRS